MRGLDDWIEGTGRCMYCGAREIQCECDRVTPIDGDSYDDAMAENEGEE